MLIFSVSKCKYFLELAVFKCVSPNCLFLIKEFRILDSTLLDQTNSFFPSHYIEEISEVESDSLPSVLNNALTYCAQKLSCVECVSKFMSPNQSKHCHRTVFFS